MRRGRQKIRAGRWPPKDWTWRKGRERDEKGGRG